MTRSTNTRRLSAAHAAPHLRPQSRLRGRRGVTLVEMLVATAMCILGMWMLTWMFQQATASFSLANAQATLTGQERMVTTIMTRDLEANKFPEDDSRATPSGRRYQKLSDFDGRVPKGGYFLARSRCPDNTFTVDEGADTNGFGSTRAGSHFIQFTVIRPDEPGNRLVAEVPAQRGITTAGTAAEVSYFLRDTGTTTSTNAKIYDLMRSQRLVALNKHDKADYETSVLNTPNGYGPGPAISDVVHEVMVATPPDYAASTPAQMHTLADLARQTQQGNSFGWPRFNPLGAVVPPTPAPPFGGARTPTSRRYGEDRLLSNVLSMEVKFTGTTSAGRPFSFAPNPNPWPVSGVNGSASNVNSPLQWPRPFELTTNPDSTVYTGNKDYPYDFLPFDGDFDTANPDGTIPIAGGGTQDTRQRIRITGIQIKIRALFGTTARQTTIIVAQ